MKLMKQLFLVLGFSTIKIKNQSLDILISFPFWLTNVTWFCVQGLDSTWMPQLLGLEIHSLSQMVCYCSPLPLYDFHYILVQLQLDREVSSLLSSPSFHYKTISVSWIGNFHWSSWYYHSNWISLLLLSSDVPFWVSSLALEEKFSQLHNSWKVQKHP